MLRVYGSAVRLKSTCTCFVGDDHDGVGDYHDGGGDVVIFPVTKVVTKRLNYDKKKR